MEETPFKFRKKVLVSFLLEDQLIHKGGKTLIGEREKKTHYFPWKVNESKTSYKIPGRKSMRRNSVNKIIKPY